MTIDKTINGNDITFAVSERLDTMTAPELEKALSESFSGAENLTLDFAQLSYISSAGLRVLLAQQKKANAAGGKMVIKNVNDDIMEIFEVTGFVDILTIE